MPERCSVRSCQRQLGRPAMTAAAQARGQLVCDHCLDRLEREVARLPGLYRDCEDMLAHQRGRGIERVRSTPARGVALDEDLVAVRSGMLSIAASWAGFIAQRRPTPERPQRTVPALSRFLLAHLRWLARQPSVVDAVAEIGDVVRAAEEALEPNSGRRVELGSCERPGCAGVVYATVGATSAPSRVSCEHGHMWLPAEWLSLRDRLQPSGRAERITSCRTAGRVR